MTLLVRINIQLDDLCCIRLHSLGKGITNTKEGDNLMMDQ